MYNVDMYVVDQWRWSGFDIWDGSWFGIHTG